MYFYHYLLISTICLSFLYLNYRLFFSGNTPLKTHRGYLVSALVLSIILPFSPVNISYIFDNASLLQGPLFENSASPILPVSISPKQNGLELNFFKIIGLSYFLITTLLLVRLIIHAFQLKRVALKSVKHKKDNFTLIVNTKYQSTFSIFKWIFVNAATIEQKDFEDIIAHEKIHSSQIHSLDLLLMELLAAVMWFNPLVWLMRKSISNIHEFLADEGALSTGIDRLRYQALLVNQVTEERLICVSSGFNQSLIKQRMIMMTKSKINQHSKLRILSIIPVVAILLFGIACSKNGSEKAQKVDTLDEIKSDISHYMLDGEPVENIDNIDPESIHSVDINKDTKTITVISKKYNEEHLSISNKTLFVLNGEKQDQYFSIETIDQSQIKSIDVIKDIDMVKELDDGDYHSAIIIETKE